MGTKKLNNLINSLQLQKGILPQYSVIGTGFYGACLDFYEQKKINNSLKTWKTVKLITNEGNALTYKKINEIKKSLYHKGVHVTLSDNIEDVSNEYLTLSYYDEAFAPGESIHRIRERGEDVSIPYKHLLKFFFDAYEITSHGLTIDKKGDNILYDSQKGFYFIDLGLNRNNDINNVSNILQLIQVVFCFTLPNLEISNTSTFNDTRPLIQNITKAITLLAKVHGDIGNNKFFQRWIKALNRVSNEEELLAGINSAVTYS